MMGKAAKRRLYNHSRTTQQEDREWEDLMSAMEARHQARIKEYEDAVKWLAELDAGKSFVFNLKCDKGMEASVLSHQNEIVGYTKELLTIATDSPLAFDDVNRVTFLGEAKERVRKIGEDLNIWGGFGLMLSMCEKVPSYEQRELERVWDGIGTWKC